MTEQILRLPKIVQEALDRLIAEGTVEECCTVDGEPGNRGYRLTRCPLCNDTGNQRYWEGRWRDEKAINEALLEGAERVRARRNRDVTRLIMIITEEDILAEVKRELAMRKRVYPRWIEENKISAGTAAYRIACMEALVESYEKLAEKERLL